MNSLRKRLEKWIHIERSVENDDVILRQTLKYKPKKCEDCPRTCKTRRRVAIKLNYPNPWNRAKNSFYTKMCSVCRNYQDPKTGKFNINWQTVLRHYCGQKTEK